MLKFIPIISLCLNFTSYAMDDEGPVEESNGSPLVRCPAFKNYNQQLWENDDSQGSTTEKPSSPLLVRSPGSRNVPKLIKSQQEESEILEPFESNLVRTRRSENLAKSQRDLTKALEGSPSDNSGKTPITKLSRQSTSNKPEGNSSPTFYGDKKDLWVNPEPVELFKA